uniref:Uncharacterized protein n=1 Tax=Setaria digitata TaxID=48799 RepID=A0A915Q6E8_9BILA
MPSGTNRGREFLQLRFSVQPYNRIVLGGNARVRVQRPVKCRKLIH